MDCSTAQIQDNHVNIEKRGRYMQTRKLSDNDNSSTKRQQKQKQCVRPKGELRAF